MAIDSILAQPTANSLNAAYRPILFRVQATATDLSPVPPVVYCDIYINGIYYKSLSKTHYTKLNSTNSEWEFDIQDACQEYLGKFMAPNGGTAILNAASVICSVQCKFRSSGINASGFIQYEGTQPIQGSGDVAPTAGTGTASNSIFAVNATIQQESNMDFETHLNWYKQPGWDAQMFPLTHRPNPYIITRDDSDYYPIANKNTGATIAKLALNYKYAGQSTIRRKLAVYNSAAFGLFVPAGPKNLASVFSVDFRDIETYFIQLVNAADEVMATSVTYKVNPTSNPDDFVRISFQNNLGTIDGMTFKLITREHETKSDSYEVPLSSPLDKGRHGVNRYNVKANDTFTCTCIDYNEYQMEWVDELLDSPNVWMAAKGIEGQPDLMLPVVMQDAKIVKRKEDERFINEITITFKFSNSKILLRN